MTSFRQNRAGWIASLILVGLGIIGTPVTQMLSSASTVPSQALWLAVLAITAAGFFASRGVAGRIFSTCAAALVIVAGIAVSGSWAPHVRAWTSEVSYWAVTMQSTILAVAGILIGAATAFGHVAAQGADDPDGMRRTDPPPTSASSLEAIRHYLDWFEEDFARMRRAVKKRAARVALWTASLTGIIAVLGAVSATLSNDPWLDLLAIATTAASATIAVLINWDEHFHHRELWIQRSQVLNQLQALRLEFEQVLRTNSSPRARKRQARELGTRLREILAGDFSSWSRIQGGEQAR